LFIKTLFGKNQWNLNVDTHLSPFSKSKFNLNSTLLHRLVLLSALFTQCPSDTIQTGTGKVDPARKFKLLQFTFRRKLYTVHTKFKFFTWLVYLEKLTVKTSNVYLNKTRGSSIHSFFFKSGNFFNLFYNCWRILFYKANIYLTLLCFVFNLFWFSLFHLF